MTLVCGVVIGTALTLAFAELWGLCRAAARPWPVMERGSLTGGGAGPARSERLSPGGTGTGETIMERDES